MSPPLPCNCPAKLPPYCANVPRAGCANVDAALLVACSSTMATADTAVAPQYVPYVLWYCCDCDWSATSQRYVERSGWCGTPAA